MIKGYSGAGLSEIVKRVEEIAKAKGITMAQVALAWILSKDGVSAPIVGTTNLDNLKDILGTHSSLSCLAALFLTIGLMQAVLMSS